MSNRKDRSGARSSRAQQSAFTQGDPRVDAAGHRRLRTERILLEEIRALIRDEAADPALEDVRLISVRLGVDGGHARVSYVVEASPADPRQVERCSREALRRATGFLRARLAASLDMKRLPTLSFAFVGVRGPGAPAEQEGGEPWRE